VLACAACAGGLSVGGIGGMLRPPPIPLPVCSSRPKGVARIAPIALCDSASSAPSASPPPPPPLVLIGGVPVSEGDAVLCKDHESQAWWRATVRKAEGERVLVHYMGCDDSWDEWFEAASPNILAIDAQEAARAAFQSQEAEMVLEGMDDASILDAYRQQKWDNNARWQLSTFAQTQLGKWEGTLVCYEPSRTADGSVRMVETGAHATKASAVVVKDGEIEWHETLHDERLVTTRTLRAASFDRERGTNCVGNGYSFTAGTGAEGEGVGSDGSLMFELGLRDAHQRVRVKFAFSQGTEGNMEIERVAVVREVESTLPMEPPQKLPPGGGLYDPPPGDRANYCSLYCDGGLTLVFPVKVAPEMQGFVSVDWTAGNMRYQLDRKFEKFEQRVGTLELTEISRENSEIYPPRFKDSGQAGQD